MRTLGRVGACLLTIMAVLAVGTSAAVALEPDADPSVLPVTTTSETSGNGPVQDVTGLGNGGADGTDGTAPGNDPVMVQPGFEPGALLDEPLVRLGLITLGGLSLAAGAIYGGARIVSKDELLENDTRDAIYTYLREEVGANLKQITDALDLTTTNAIWHLRKLEDAGIVKSDKFNGYKVFYPAEGGVRAKRLSISMTALNNDNARRIFEYVTEEPGAHQRQIARALDVNHGTVRWHLKKLRKAELLQEERDGRATTYFPTEMGEVALATVEGNGPGGLGELSSLV